MFRLKPEGKTLIEVCTTLSCALGGAEQLLDHTCRKLGVKPGETTADGKFTVKGVECLAACGGAPAVQVNGAWLEHATAADVDRVIAGETVARTFAWPKSPGEHILFANVWKAGLDLALRLRGGRRLRQARRVAEAHARDDHRGGQEVHPARARRGRLPDRDEVGLPAEGQPEAALHVRQRRRERAGHLQGPRDPRARPAPADRGDGRELPRDPLEDGVHLHPRRVPRGRAHARGGASPRRARRATSARTSSARASTSRSTSTAARAPTSAARRRR